MKHVILKDRKQIWRIRHQLHFEYFVVEPETKDTKNILMPRLIVLVNIVNAKSAKF